MAFTKLRNLEENLLKRCKVLPCTFHLLMGRNNHTHEPYYAGFISNSIIGIVSRKLLFEYFYIKRIFSRKRQMKQLT